MPYPGPQTWHDLPLTDTPITAADLTFMENGIDRSIFNHGISKWGLLAASMHPMAARSISGYGGTAISALAFARVWIPAGVTITNVAGYVTVVGSGAAGTGPNGYAVYEISGSTATLAQNTANDSTLWTTTGWRPKALPSAIASQGAEREVLLGVGITLATLPSVGGILMGSGAAMNRTVGGTTIGLTYYLTAQASWPGTINLSTAATDSGMLCLGVT